MREKKDSIFNSDILQQTAHLTHEEFGLFIRMAMIEDDELTEKRYENISGVFLNAYMKIEEQWKEDFKPYINDIKAMTDYSTIYTSAAKSRKGYNQLKETLENKKGGNGTNTGTGTETGNITENVITSNETNIYTDCFTFGTKNIVVKYTTDTIKNIPEKDDIEDLKINCDDDLLIKMLETGNAEKWKRHYEEILNELQAEQQLETETPFDCLESEDR